MPRRLEDLRHGPVRKITDTYVDMASQNTRDARWRLPASVGPEGNVTLSSPVSKLVLAGWFRDPKHDWRACPNGGCPDDYTCSAGQCVASGTCPPGGCPTTCKTVFVTAADAVLYNGNEIVGVEWGVRCIEDTETKIAGTTIRSIRGGVFCSEVSTVEVRGSTIANEIGACIEYEMNASGLVEKSRLTGSVGVGQGDLSGQCRR
jgi:hypothetical protein